MKIWEIIKGMFGAIPVKGWIFVALVVVIFFLWQLGTVGAGIDQLKKAVFGPYERSIAQLKSEKERLDAELIALKSKIDEQSEKIQRQNERINDLKSKIIDSNRRIIDVEKRLSSITVPSDTHELVAEFKQLGYSSARVRTKSR